MRLFILALAAVALALFAGSAFATPYYLVKTDGSPAYDYGVLGDGSYYRDYRNYYNSYYTYTTPYYYNSYGSYRGYPGYGSYLTAPAIPSYYWNFDTYNMPWQRYGYNTPYYYGSTRQLSYYDYVYTNPYVYIEYRG